MSTYHIFLGPGYISGTLTRGMPALHIDLCSKFHLQSSNRLTRLLIGTRFSHCLKVAIVLPPDWVKSVFVRTGLGDDDGFDIVEGFLSADTINGFVRADVRDVTSWHHGRRRALLRRLLSRLPL